MIIPASNRRRVAPEAPANKSQILRISDNHPTFHFIRIDKKALDYRVNIQTWLGLCGHTSQLQSTGPPQTVETVQVYSLWPLRLLNIPDNSLDAVIKS